MLATSVCTLLITLTVGDEKAPELDVPFEPTHPAVVQAMLELAEVTAKDTLYDLGCGDGRIVIAAADRRGARGFGVDIDPQRIKEAAENAKAVGVSDRVKFLKQDLKHTDLTGATVVTLYLLDSVNLMVRPTLFRDLAPGTRIVSHAFDMGDWEPDTEESHPKARGKVLYRWLIPARVGGTWEWTEKAKGGEVRRTLRLEQRFQRLEGTLSGPEAWPVEGHLSGRELTVRARPPKGRPGVELVFHGAVKGDELAGVQKREGGNEPGESSWRATRVPVNLPGEWRVTVKLGPTELSGRLHFETVEGKLTARYVKDADESEVEPTFYAWGASVRFEVSHEDEVYVFDGFFSKDSASGKVSQEDSERHFSWTAGRVAKK